MSLELYHLHLSVSERVVWLLEEMEIPYTLHIFKRDPVTMLAPKELKAINPAGTAPYFRDNSVSPPVAMTESTAIISYILGVYGPKAAAGTPRMFRTPDDPDYATYLQWLHFASGTLQPGLQQMMGFAFSGVADLPGPQTWRERTNGTLRLADSHLGKNKWFAGESISAADCIAMFSFSTMRGFSPFDLEPYPNILRWMQDVAARPAYRRALQKADEGMEPLIAARVPGFTEFAFIKAMLEKN